VGDFDNSGSLLTRLGQNNDIWGVQVHHTAIGLVGHQGSIAHYYTTRTDNCLEGTDEFARILHRVALSLDWCVHYTQTARVACLPADVYQRATILRVCRIDTAYRVADSYVSIYSSNCHVESTDTLLYYRHATAVLKTIE
jgi:hypothetical protein